MNKCIMKVILVAVKKMYIPNQLGEVIQNRMNTTEKRNVKERQGKGNSELKKEKEKLEERTKEEKLKGDIGK